MENKRLNDNWIFENATLDICCGCKDNPYMTAAECLKRREESCPHEAHLSLVEALSTNLLKIIDEAAKVSHHQININYYNITDLLNKKNQEVF